MSANVTLTLGAFSPTDVSGLKAWFDFSDAWTLFQDAAMTSLVTADGQVILGARDKSGIGNHITTATNGPTYKENITNGRSVARFDGANDHLFKSPLVGQPYAQPNTVAWVAKQDVASADDYFFSFAGSECTGTVSGALYVAAGAAANTTDYVPVASPTVFVLGLNGASSTIHVNGVAKTFSASIGTGGATVLYLGIHHTLAVPLDGDYHEFIYYNALLSDADRNNVESYLGTKWGITVA